MENAEDRSTVITPTPGFVLKGDHAGKKIFLNICYSDFVRSTYTDGSGNVRIPVSLGELVNSFDKGGAPVTTVDVIASENSVRHSVEDESFKREFIRIIAVGLKLKYDIAVSNFRPVKIQYKGNTVLPQRIRLDPEALIQEVKTRPYASSDCSSHRGYVPEFTFFLVNDEGATLNVLELPEYKSTAATLRDNLIAAFSDTVTAPLDNLTRFSRAEIVIRGVSAVSLFRLQLSSERLVISSKTLSLSGSVSVCRTLCCLSLW
jgi:hypothetical protein